MFVPEPAVVEWMFIPSSVAARSGSETASASSAATATTGAGRIAPALRERNGGDDGG